MSGQGRDLFDKPSLLPVMLIAVALVYLMRQLALAPDFMDILALSGADDAMRLQSVRDLMAGQGWYDTRQYRVLPPEGISLHWSRLVDAPMVALLSVLGWVTGPEAAERLLVLIWPMVLFLVFAFVTMRTTRIGFGVSAAAFALISLWFLQSHHTRYFPLGRLDHHNIQVLLMLAVFGLLLARGWKAAVLAGVISALSLAVGMESLPFLGLAGLVWVWRYLRGDHGGAEALAGFGISLGLTAPLLFALQTDPGLWAMRVCDQLSLPYLGLCAGAAILGVIVLLTRRRLSTTRARAVVLAASSVVLGGLVLPGLAPCFAGPFADVSDDVRSQVISRIGESAPAALVIRQVPEMAVVLLAPLGVITVLAVGIWVSKRKHPDDAQSWGLLVMFLILGCAGAFLQLRAMIWGHAVMAVGFGAVMAHLVNRPWPIPRAIKAVAMILVFATVFLPQLLPIGYRLIETAFTDTRRSPAAPAIAQIDAACDDASLLSTLSSQPPALIASPLNLGTGILVHTRHSVTAAPYHRGTDAMLNGVLPFTGDMVALRRMIDTTGAELILVCNGQTYGAPGSAGSRLAAGQGPGWLVPVEGTTAPLMLFQVDE